MLSVVWLASALPSLRATKGVPLTLKLGKRRVKHLGLLGFRVNPMLVTAQTANMPADACITSFDYLENIHCST